MKALAIFTKEDLEQLRQRLLKDIKPLIDTQGEQFKQWLKSTEVRKPLVISTGNLQKFRINGTQKYGRVGINLPEGYLNN